MRGRRPSPAEAVSSAAMVARFRRGGPESATPTRQQSFRRQPLPNNSTGGGASSVPATPIRAPDREKVRKNRQDRSVDRRKRLSHVGSQGLASLWGRRLDRKSTRL